MQSAQIIQCIKKSEGLIQRTDRRMNGMPLPPDIRTRLAAGCLMAAQDHNRGITLLVAHHIYGSAAALARPLFESYVRGVWLHKCATDVDLESFQKNNSLNALKLLKQIESVPGFQEGVLSKIGGNHWAALCSYAHSGILQASRYNTESYIEPAFEDDVLLELIHFGDTVGLMVAIAIADLADNRDLAQACLNEMKAA